ncbi:MAG TPA: hypothetical protein VFS05_10075 [Gemmatimonadaceae bacterium]|nr:hypothetical protein [Gemmatimonadaceae bacterium]
MRVHRLTLRAAPAIALALVLGCDAATPTGPATSAPSFSQSGGIPPLPPPSDFVAVVTNPYFPLIPGTTFTYSSVTDEGVETNTVEVTYDTKVILGITATVVHDRVYLDGVLTEDTFDWYAQDSQGNIWYLGEQSCEIENGACVSTEGSWQAGVDGAQAGILMWANPAAHKGKTYRQEFLAGEAEDMAKVLRLNASVTVPYGSFSGCLETMEWSPLEPGVREHKFYCPGVGTVLEVQPKGGRVESELVSVARR